MKNFFILFFVFFTSCGDVLTDEDGVSSGNDFPEGAVEYSSYDEFFIDFVKEACNKIFNCEEGKSVQDFYGTDEQDCIKKFLEKGSSGCTGFISGTAEECISCFKRESCADYFDEATLEKCPSCDELCEEF